MLRYAQVTFVPAKVASLLQRTLCTVALVVVVLVFITEQRLCYMKLVQQFKTVESRLSCSYIVFRLLCSLLGSVLAYKHVQLAVATTLMS